MGLIKTAQPALHGDQHLADGSDPIPGIGGLPVPYGQDVVGLIMATGPDGFWKLDELTGDVAHDSSGNAHDMTSGVSWGPPVWGQPAGPPGLTTAKWPVSAAPSTPDTREVVAMPTAFTDDFTAAVWFDILTSHGNNNLFGQIASGGTNGWYLSANASTGYAFAQAATDTMYSNTAIVSTGSWYFIALVRDGGTWKFYVNGILQSATSTASPGAGSTDTWLGTVAAVSGSGYAQDVLMSCAFITARPLTSMELLAIYEAGISGGVTAANKVWTALGDGTADWRDPTILVEF